MNALANSSPVKLSHQFKKGDIVAYSNVSVNGTFYSRHLLEVRKVHRKSDYVEIRETLCSHCNRGVWGSNGSDIRHATEEEIKARTRLPRLVYDEKLVFNDPALSDDLLDHVHYSAGNNMLIKSPSGDQQDISIYDVREATEEEVAAGHRILSAA